MVTDRLRTKPVNKLAVALAVREAMRAHREGKPISFPDQRWPRV